MRTADKVACAAVQPRIAQPQWPGHLLANQLARLLQVKTTRRDVEHTTTVAPVLGFCVDAQHAQSCKIRLAIVIAAQASLWFGSGPASTLKA